MSQTKQEIVYGLGGKEGAVHKAIDYVQKGWTVDYDQCRAIGGGYYTITVVKDGEALAEPEQAPVQEPEQAEPEELTLEEQVNAMTKKAPLLEFAEQHSIEVPEELLQPSAIKKFILEQLVS